MPMRRSLLALALTVSLTGCYHATVTAGTSVAPAPAPVSKTFASSWLWGLVPPATIDATAACPRGIARVETQLSFTNQLVNFITGGIYTPMSIVVTCVAEQ